MSWQATSWAVSVTTGSPTRKVVLLALANYADAEGRCWPSQLRLARETETSERTIRRALADLENVGLITRIKRRNPVGEVITSAYQLRLDSPPAKLAGGETHHQRPDKAQSTGQAMAGKPPSEPLSKPPPNLTSGVPDVWGAAAELEIAMEAAKQPIRNRTGLRRVILSRYKAQGGPNAEILEELRRRTSMAIKTTASTGEAESDHKLDDRHAMEKGRALLRAMKNRKGMKDGTELPTVRGVD